MRSNGIPAPVAESGFDLEDADVPVDDEGDLPPTGGVGHARPERIQAPGIQAVGIERGELPDGTAPDTDPVLVVEAPGRPCF